MRSKEQPSVGRRRVMMFGATALMAGAANASVYVDDLLTELPPGSRATIASPPPVQLLSEFQTAGAINAKATKYAAPLIEKEVAASGLIGATGPDPRPDGGRLSVLINDIPDKGAAGKGFAAGLTLGLAGVVAGDSYDVTVTYTPAGGAPPIARTEHYRIVFKFGSKTLPPHLVKVKGVTEASNMMIHLTVAHALDEIARDPAFASTGKTSF